MTPQYGYALIGLTAIVGLLAGLLAFAGLRLVAAARETGVSSRPGGGELALMASALQAATTRLQTQEQTLSERAEASERLYREIVASMPVGLLVVDPSGEVQMLNPAGRQMLGIGAEVPLGEVRAQVAPDAALLTTVDDVLRTHEPITRRGVLHVVNGRERQLGLTGSSLQGAGGAHGAICLFSDLTAVIQMEEQLRLKEALARLGEMTAGIAHEFRNGLATIHGYSRLMPAEALPEPFRPYVAAIRAEAEALGRVVTNFLTFARPDSVHFFPVDLASVVARVVDDARHLHPDATIDVDGHLPMVAGDEVLLRQLVMNLVRNGLEACAGVGRPGAILIEAQRDDVAQVCRLVVHDGGPGVEPGLRDRVFQPFFTARPGGTGLGLAIVQKVAVMHNGRATIEASTRLSGAAVRVTLPLEGMA